FSTATAPRLPTLSLHDALPIYHQTGRGDTKTQTDERGQGGDQPSDHPAPAPSPPGHRAIAEHAGRDIGQAGGHSAAQGRQAEQRSEEHTSELQSRENLVCRLLL